MALAVKGSDKTVPASMRRSVVQYETLGPGVKVEVGVADHQVCHLLVDAAAIRCRFGIDRLEHRQDGASFSTGSVVNCTSRVPPQVPDTEESAYPSAA